MHPTRVIAPDLKAITVLLASTATPERGGLTYFEAVLPAEDRLAATRVVRDLGTIPPDAILYLLAQPAKLSRRCPKRAHARWLRPRPHVQHRDISPEGR